MATEIDEPCDINVPTEDFSIPDPVVFHSAVVRAYIHMIHGRGIYVGCMGGIGRTGLFMAAMVKVMLLDMLGDGSCNFTVLAINYVRKHYKEHAVETEAQDEFIQAFDAGLVLETIQLLKN